MVSSSVSEHLFRYMYSIIVVTFPSNDATLFLLVLSSQPSTQEVLVHVVSHQPSGQTWKNEVLYSKRMATPSNVFSH